MNLTLLKRALFFGLLGAALYGAVTFLYLAALKIHFPYMVNLGESSLSQAIFGWQQGLIPYRWLDTPPYTLTPYGPVYIAVTASALHFFGTPFAAGRVVTLVCTLLVAILSFKVLQKSGVGKSTALLAALFFISQPYIYQWGVLVNVDMTGVCLDLAAFLLFMKAAEDEKRFVFLTVMGILASVAAFFSKSSMIAAPAAFFCFLLFRGEWKKAAFLFLVEASIAGAAYGVINYLSDNMYFFHTTYEIGKRKFFPVFILRFWKDNVVAAPVLFAAAFYGLWSLFLKKKNLLGWYLLFSILLTFSLGKQGSDTNYFLTYCVAANLALGVLLDRVSKKTWVAVVFYLLLFVQLFFWIRPYGNWEHTKTNFEKARKFFDGVSLLVKKTNGEVLSEDMSLLLANNKKIFYEPFPMGQMSYSGVWDEELILNELREQRFSLAILYFYAPLLRANRNFTPNFMTVFNEQYRFIGRAVPDPELAKAMHLHALYFYLPKKE